MADTTHLHALISIPAEARRLYPRGELYGLDQSQMQVLVALAIGDVDHTAGLAELLVMNRTTVSHSLRALADQRLARRDQTPESWNRSRFSLTAKGKRIVDTFADSRATADLHPRLRGHQRSSSGRLGRT